MKKLLSLFLLFALCLSLVPASVFAADGEETLSARDSNEEEIYPETEVTDTPESAAETIAEAVTGELIESTAETDAGKTVSDMKPSSAFQGEESSEETPENKDAEEVAAETMDASELSEETENLTENGDATTSGTCGENLTWSLTSGVLTISGTGAMTDWDSMEDVPWYSRRTSVTSIEISDGVTTIGDQAFTLCSVTGVEIPDSVTTIGYAAFDSCRSMTSVKISKNATAIEDYAFAGCISLKSVIIPDSVLTIGEHAFVYCRSLTSVIIPDSVTSIGTAAFLGCSGLVSVVLPDSVTTLGTAVFQECVALKSVILGNGISAITYGMFGSCSNLESIEIPAGITSIEPAAFASCSSLVSMEIPAGVTSIESSTFGSCSSLRSVKIPDSVVSIARYAFDGCANLSDIYYSGTEKQWKSISIDNVNTGNEFILSATIHYTEEKKAIIVVPGITGSELYVKMSTGTEEKIWIEEGPILGYSAITVEGFIADLKLDDTGNTIYDVYARDDSVSQYGTNDTYKKLMNDLEKAYSTEYEVRLFSYDWRLTNSISADSLNSFIEDNGYTEVILVAHSMGGIVSSAYIDKYGDSKVDKLITLGTPYYGTPKALGAFETGYFLEADNALKDWAQRQIIKGLAPNMCGLYELLPIAPYFNDGVYYVNDSDGNPMDCNQTISFMSNFDWYNRFLHNQALTFYSGILDTYEKIRTGEVDAYVIVGYNKMTPAVYITNRKGELVNLTTTYEGDGTVMLQSATMAYSMDEDRLYCVNGVNHNGLVKNSYSIQLVKNIIDGKGDTEDFAADCGGIISHRIEETPNHNVCAIRAACPVNMKVYDKDNNLIGSFIDGVLTASEGYENNMYYLGDDNEIKIAFVPEGARFEIEGTGKGTMDLSISKIAEEEVVSTVTYSLVEVTENTEISAPVDVSEDATIPVDTDGDGEVDETVSQDVENDINGDHTVNVMDIVSLMKFLIGGNNQVVEVNLDVNDDSTINLLDLVVLLKTLVNAK